MNRVEKIRCSLFEKQDLPYRDFIAKLIPNISKETIIGVRSPELKAMAKDLLKTKEATAFLAQLPHAYFEENQLHAYLLGHMKDFDEALSAIEVFLPYINNWATCDHSPAPAFKKHPEKILKAIVRWLESEEVYTLRYAIGLLMRIFLDNAFDKQYLGWVAKLKHPDYYVQMMQAWYFCEALIKQKPDTWPIFETQLLDKWVHNKAIQKAVESYRIDEASKTALRLLRRK